MPDDAEMRNNYGYTLERGGQIDAAPVTFALNGKQFVVIAAGGDLITFGLPQLPSWSANRDP